MPVLLNFIAATCGILIKAEEILACGCHAALPSILPEPDAEALREEIDEGKLEQFKAEGFGDGVQVESGEGIATPNDIRFAPAASLPS